MRSVAALILGLAAVLAVEGIAAAQSIAGPSTDECRQLCALAAKSALSADQKQKLQACVLNRKCANADDGNRKINPLVGPYNSRF